MRSRFPSELDFDDIIQDAFVSAWIAQEKGVLRTPKAFLFGAVRNLALVSLRSRKVNGKNVRQLDSDVEKRISVAEGAAVHLPDGNVLETTLAPKGE